jgi:serine/threonine protein kinase
MFTLQGFRKRAALERARKDRGGATTAFAYMELPEITPKQKRPLKKDRKSMEVTRKALGSGGRLQWQEVQSHEMTDAVPIGRGAFGDVFRVKCRGLVMAKKDMRAPSMAEEDKTRRYLVREVRAMGDLHHTNVIRLLGVCVEPGNLCLLMEFAELGTLRDQLDQHLMMPAWRRYNLLLNVASGMCYLHAHTPNPILHRDLKTLNVLITRCDEGSWIAKIADFGLAVGSGLNTSAQSNATGTGTVSHSPPEAIDGGEFTMAGDCYSFGMVVFEVLTGQLPFEGRDVPAIMNLVLNKAGRPLLPRIEEPPPSFSGEQWRFLVGLVPGGSGGGAPPGGCWAQEPSARPSFDELVGAFRAQANLFHAGPPAGLPE